MRILFLNQYFPPDPAPTGILFHEVAEALKADGHEVDFVAARQDYRPGQKKKGRMKRELLALGRMLIDGIFRRRPDVVVSGTSPPCLLVAATFIALWHRAKSVHWIMDLYPEIAVALGEVRAGRMSHWIGAVMGWGYRWCSKVVVLDEDMAERIRAYRVKTEIIRPWVFASVLPRLAEASSAPDPEWTWIYSGNLGRAHEWVTLLEAQAELEVRQAGVRLIFQGGGPSWPVARVHAEALRLKRCRWTDYVDEADLPNSLLRCEVLAVTELPAVQGLLWPSKLGLVLSLPRAILWVGPSDGAIARMLRTIPSAGVFAPGQSREIAEWIMERKSAEANSINPAIDPAAHRRDSLAAWRHLIAGLNRR